MITWDAAHKGAAVTLSNGNLTASGSANESVRATQSYSGQAIYVEFLINTAPTYGAFVGLVGPTDSMNYVAGSSADGWTFCTTGKSYNSGSQTSYGLPCSNGDIVGMIWDGVAGTLEFFKNGVSMGVAFTGVTGTLFPACCPGTDAYNGEVTLTRILLGYPAFLSDGFTLTDTMSVYKGPVAKSLADGFTMTDSMRVAVPPPIIKTVADGFTLTDSMVVVDYSSYDFITVSDGFTMTDSMTTRVSSYEIIASASPGGEGTISPSGSVFVAAGGSQPFTITPAPGFMILSVLVNGVSQPEYEGVFIRTVFGFNNVTENQTIAVTFATIGFIVNQTMDVFPSLPNIVNGQLEMGQLPGLMWNIERRPIGKNLLQESQSQKETAQGQALYPLHEWDLSYESLNDSQGYQELQQILGLYLKSDESLSTFLLLDPHDYTTSNGILSAPDGSRTTFQMFRTYGYGNFTKTEPVAAPTGIFTVSKNGVDLLPGVDYTISLLGVVTFTVAPLATDALLWSGSFYWPVRFGEDQYDFEEIMWNLYNIKKITLHMRKLYGEVGL